MSTLSSYSKFIKTLVSTGNYVYIPNKALVQSIKVGTTITNPVNAIVDITDSLKAFTYPDLNTTAKTVAGAINEVYNTLDTKIDNTETSLEQNITSSIATHNTSTNAHSTEISTAINTAITNHNNSTSVHEAAITAEVTEQLTAHNNNPHSHDGLFLSSKPDDVNYLIDSNDKINTTYLPDTILGQLKYGGTFNGSGIITASSEATSINGANISTINTTTYEGYYFIATAPYTINSVEYTAGDWAIAQAAETPTFEKVPNTDAVSSVNNKTGVVILSATDVGAASVGDLATKQDILTAGNNITITDNTIGVTTIATPIAGSTKPITSGGVYTALQNKVNSSSLATVATSGSYNDLLNKPTIPDAVTDLTDAANYAKNSDLATVATSGLYVDLLNKPTIPNKTSDLTNDSNYVVSTSLATVATSGNYNDLTNKPTIPAVVLVDTAMSDTSTNAVQNKVIKAYVDANSGAVQSVNGKTGIVSLTASDVSALPSSTVIPTKTSDLTNDSNFVTTATSALTNYYTKTVSDGKYALITALPTKTSDLTNDSNFQNATQVTTAINSAIGTTSSLLGNTEDLT